MAAEVTARTNALEKSRKEAREALEADLEVLAFVAHEIKSPVAGALTALEVIEMGCAGEVPGKMRPSLEKLRRYLNRGLEMAVNFTYLSRVESSGFDIAMTPMDSLRTEVVEPAAADFVDEAVRRGMPIRIEGDAPLEGDPQLLRIVLDNLIGNAVKYGEEGTPIEVRIAAGGENVRISVRNQGVGIEDRHHPDLFRKFGRVDDKRLRGRRGSGVGLYLSRLIVELHGGGIAVTGEYGTWVEFTVELPA
jgi:signal transduction histidine kinase